MRTRDEMNRNRIEDYGDIKAQNDLILETLLDIRDLLNKNDPPTSK